jgi:hypothetical protein
MRNRPAANGTAIRKASTPSDNTETTKQLQARRLARLFFVTPETAATIAQLAYGVAQ